MALMACSECGKQISDQAVACPSCGAPTSSQVRKLTTPAKTRRSSGVAQLLLLALICFAVLLFWRAESSQQAAPPSAGLAGLLRSPQTVVNERVALKEGISAIYSFTLSTDSRIRVTVTASPEPVDVMLMTKGESDKFRKVSGQLFGGQYTYRQALSSQRILTMGRTEAIPAGAWAIVVMRPLEHLLFHKDTAASVVITAF